MGILHSVSLKERVTKSHVNYQYSGRFCYCYFHPSVIFVTTNFSGKNSISLPEPLFNPINQTGV